MRPWFLVALASLYLWCCAAQEHIDWLKRLSESPVQDVDELLRDASIVNILVTGATGAAKSSLINSIRRMKDYEPGAAAVDVRECTSEVVKYPSSDGSVVYHDVPGVGTLNWPKSSYLYDIQVDTFDVFLVVKAADRTTETDVWLVEQLVSLHKTVYVVNTKIDELLQNKKRSLRPGEFNKDTELKRNREATDGEFQRRGISFSQSAGVQLFQVSNHYEYWDDFDLNALKYTLLAGLSFEKRMKFQRNMRHYVEDRSSKLRYNLRNTAEQWVFQYATAHASVSAVNPIPFGTWLVGYSVVNRMDSEIQKLYGLDESSLATMASRFNDAVITEVAEAVSGGLIAATAAAAAVEYSILSCENPLCHSVMRYLAPQLIEVELLKVVPVVGTIVNALFAYRYVYFLGHDMIERAEILYDRLAALEASRIF